MTAKVRRSRFRGIGGIHPPYCKSATAGHPIETMPPPVRLLVSLHQNSGSPSNPLVKRGDAVLRGQPVGEPSGYFSSAVHAPVSGLVKSVETMTTVTGRTAAVVEIESDGRDLPFVPEPPPLDWNTGPPGRLIERIAEAGIIGMGGAGFPTHVKLSPLPGKPVHTLILNGAECEPYLTADHRLMVEQAETVWRGAQILARILGVKAVRIAIEDNKSDAIWAMEKVLAGTDADVEITVLETEYPQGAEKQLIHSVLGREVPSGGLPIHVGVLVENVATTAAVYDAVTGGLPLMHRVITVSGDCVATPKNVLARVGTPLGDLLAFCGGQASDPGKILCGGPMMGIALDSLEPGIDKTTSGLLLFHASRVHCYTSMPCIRCSRCVRACPMHLLPCTLSETIEAEDYASAENIQVMDCIECGSCAYVCPAHRPLVQHMKQGKTRVAWMREKRKSTMAETR